MSVGSFEVYLQLLAGWILVNILTFLMALVPYSAAFLDIETDLNWRLKPENFHDDPDDR